VTFLILVHVLSFIGHFFFDWTPSTKHNYQQFEKECALDASESCGQRRSMSLNPPWRRYVPMNPDLNWYRAIRSDKSALRQDHVPGRAGAIGTPLGHCESRSYPGICKANRGLRVPPIVDQCARCENNMSASSALKVGVIR
jgi:hypothetical protein